MLSVLAAVAALWKPTQAGIHAWKKRTDRKVELIDAIAEAARRDIDATRWVLIQEYGDSAGPGYIPDYDGRARRAEVLRADLERARARLWKALGFPDPSDTTGPQLTAAEKEALLEFRDSIRRKALALTPEKRQVFIEEQRKQQAP